ncbi:MAG: hypothetical protein GXC75_15110 [Xanthomonadaceae bacterium]|nr:hypothetical protein [Xanthomonadaceae bacterium]
MSVAASHGPASISVPEKQAAAINAFTKLPADTQAEIYQTLSGIPTSTAPWLAVREAIEEIVDGDTDAKALVSAIRGLFYIRRFADDKADDEFVKLAMAGISKAVGLDARKPDQQLQSVIVNLLALKNLDLSHRAARVRFDHANHMHDALIVTDLRPIFDRGGATIEGAVVSHTLRIDFAGTSEDEQTLYLAIDGDDLDKLEAVIQRARRKELALKSFAGSSNLNLIEDDL